MAEILENIPLAPYTTLKVGGSARFFIEAVSDEDIPSAVTFAKENKLELFVLGGGSNIVVSDSGFNGVVLHIASKGVERVSVDEDGSVLIDVAAGENWDEFVAYCVENNLAGVECMSGIPGTVGGTPVQNVGAYGQEVAETIESVRCYDLQRNQFVELTKDECGFSYRQSIFNSSERGRYIVTGVCFRLNTAIDPNIKYAELKRMVELSDQEPTLAFIRSAVLKIRAAKSMVIDNDDPNSRSAGSFFKNPIVDVEIAEKIIGVPTYPADSGKVKLSAAWLIENAGFHKGFSLGNAAISQNHSLAIINLGDASTTEILSLKALIQTGVLDKFGIELQPEPVFVGF